MDERSFDVSHRQRCACEAGTERACGNDDCGLGTQSCGSDGTWSDCADDDSPSGEQCDGVDNDCDGDIDEYDGASEVGGICPPGQTCEHGDCVDLGGGDPPDESGADTVTAGCGCRTSGSGSLAGMALLLAAIVVARRRR